MDLADTSITVREAHIGGFQTTVRSIGRKAGQAVVFLHGMFFSSVVYERVMRAVAEKG